MPEQEIEQAIEQKGKSIFNKIIDRTIDFIFSRDSRKWLILIMIFGFVMRILLSMRAEFGADEMVHGTHAIGFIESGKLQIMDQDAVWFWLVDLTMKVLGSTVFGIRFLSILLGTFSILLVYLLGKEIFSQKVGLIAAFILAVSPFQLFQTVALMDIPMSFFAMFAMYLLVLFFKSNTKKFLYLAWISLGVAIMIKQIAILFVPAFALFMIYYNKKHQNSYKYKQIILAAVIILLMVMPVLTFNYLLFKDKGITDIQFARFTRQGLETYAGIAESAQAYSPLSTFISYNGGPPGFIVGLNSFYTQETLLVAILALIGAGFLLISKNKFKWLLVLSFLFPYLFLAGTSLLSNHLIFGTFFTSLLASLAIDNLSSKLKDEKIRKYLIYFILFLILVVAVYRVQTYTHTLGFFGTHHMEKLIGFKEENIEENSLVVVDSRIYRGRIVFMFNDRHYLESNYFPAVVNNPDQFSGVVSSIPVYYIEAVTDDSGWGTIKDQPEANSSSEIIADFFKEKSTKLTTIKDIWGKDHFSVYRTTLGLKPSVINFADSTHEWFYYPVGYQPLNKNFDHYEIYTTADSLLDKFAHLILYLDILAAGLLLGYICYLTYKSS